MKKESIFYKIGIGLLIVSTISWFIPLIVPFTSFSIKIKAEIITAFLVFAEVTFWIGVLLAGKEVATKFKSYLNPKNWRKKQIDRGLKDNEE